MSWIFREIPPGISLKSPGNFVQVNMYTPWGWKYTFCV